MQNTTKKIESNVTQAININGTKFESNFIPQSFWLGGLKINVQLDTSLIEKASMIGKADYVSQSILIDPSITPLQTTEQAYFHELVHWIFYVMNEKDLRNNEKLVDMFAQLLYQALTSAKPLSGADASDEEPHDVEFCGPPRPPVCQKKQSPNPNEPDYKVAPLFGKEEPFFIPVPWWHNPEDDCEEHFRDDEDYSAVEYDGDSIKAISDSDDYLESVDFDNYYYDDSWSVGYDPNADEKELAQMEWEEEEESRRELQSEQASWTDYADSWARSEDEGWFYGDED